MILACDPPAIEHGGSLATAEARFGRPADGWVDLSTGINPWPYPLPPLADAAWTRLPERADVDRLAATAAACYGAPAGSSLAVAPGTQALLQLVPRLLRPAPAAVLEPTYGEHAPSWRLAGHPVTAVASLAEADAAGAVHVVVVNPNNPDGRVVPPAALLAAADRLAARGGWLLVDEAFADVVPDASVAAAVGRPGLCVLRSFGKFYGLAGVRLGFALGPAALIRRVDAALGPWATSGPAIAVGQTALADGNWAGAMRDRLRQAAARLDCQLAAGGLTVVGGTPLYRLVRSDRAAEVHARLGAAGILVRAFPTQPDWLRFGLPPTVGAEHRLNAALG